MSICFRKDAAAVPRIEGGMPAEARSVDAIVFGSDQGLVGRFNDLIVDFAVENLAAMPGNHRVMRAQSCFGRASLL